MKFKYIIGKKIVIEFNNDLEKKEFKQGCINNGIHNYDTLKYSWKLYRIDVAKNLQGTDIKSFYLEKNYKIINYKEFNNNISFKDLFNQYSVHCDTEDKAKHFLKLCDDNDIIWNDGKIATKYDDFYSFGNDSVYKLTSNNRIIRNGGYYENTIIYEKFMSLLNGDTYKEEEVNNNTLKDLINKYLIKEGDFNKDSLSLIDFINECNDRFKLNLL